MLLNLRIFNIFFRVDNVSVLLSFYVNAITFVALIFCTRFVSKFSLI